jgi:hypothetical protein
MTKLNDSFPVSEFRFLREQRGAVETLLETALSQEFALSSAVLRAYLVQVTYGLDRDQINVVLAVRTKSDREEHALLDRASAVFRVDLWFS